MPGWFDTLRSWVWPTTTRTSLVGANPFLVPSDPAVSDPWGSDSYRDGQWSPIIAPVRTNPEADQLRADAYVPPYTGPLDLDDHGRETAEMRRAYRDFHRSEPAIRSAIDGKAAAVAALDVSVIPEDKDSPADRAAAEFVDWTVRRSRDGWDGLILTVLRPALIDGFSIAEKVLRGVDDSQRWRGFHGLRHVKGRDTQHLMLRMDAYRNVLGVVSTVRGLRTFDPAKVILFTHAEMFDSPFGQSDLRAAYRSAALIADAYKMWHIALRLYSQPYAHGKVSHPGTRPQMESALKSLRASGWAVTPKEDEIALLNLASATGYDAFERKVRILREDIFLAVRGAYTPFMQSNAGAGESRGDASVSQGAGSDPVEELLARAVARCLTRELVPDLVRANFGPGVGLPSVALGGVNWGEMRTRLEIIERAKRLSLSVSAKWAHDVLQIPPATGPKDELGGGPTQPGGSPPGDSPPDGTGSNSDSPGEESAQGEEEPSDGFPELIQAMLEAKASGDEDAVARLAALGHDPARLAATVTRLRAEGVWGDDDEAHGPVGTEPTTFSAWPGTHTFAWEKSPTDKSPERIKNEKGVLKWGKEAEAIWAAQERAKQRESGGTSGPTKASGGPSAGKKAKPDKSSTQSPGLFDHPAGGTQSLSPTEKSELLGHIQSLSPEAAKQAVGSSAKPPSPGKNTKARAEALTKSARAEAAPSLPLPDGKKWTKDDQKAPTAQPPGGTAKGTPPTPPSGPAPGGNPPGHNPFDKPKLGNLDDFKKVDKVGREDLIKQHLLPTDWQEKSGMARKSRTDLTRAAERTKHLETKSNSDLYGLIHHYATGEADGKMNGWAASANEVLMSRLLSQAGAKLSQQRGWDGSNADAVFNYKLLTGRANPQDNFRGNDIGIVTKEMAKTGQQDKGFARVTLNLRRKLPGSKGIHIYPGFGQGKYTNKVGDHNSPSMVGSEEDYEKWAKGEDHTLPAKLSKALTDMDWKKVKGAMKDARDKHDGAVVSDVMVNNPEVLAKSLADLKRDKKKVVFGHLATNLSAEDKEAFAADLLKSLPPEALARLLPATQSKSTKPKSTKPK
jgi:hypothetical protein